MKEGEGEESMYMYELKWLKYDKTEEKRSKMEGEEKWLSLISCWSVALGTE